MIALFFILLPQILPTMDKVISEMSRLAAEYAEVPMLSRTHGQTASPTTMGREMAVFVYRLKRQRDQVRGISWWRAHIEIDRRVFLGLMCNRNVRP